jgi:uncharacterized protein
VNIETNLAKLANWGEERFEENEHFKQFLLQTDPTKVDEQVIHLNQEVESRIDCTTCGNCCKHLMVNIDDEAVLRLAEKLQLTETQFRERFVETGSFMQFLNAIPCQFLGGTKCTVYEIRPDECRSFPRLNQVGFTTRMFGTFSHYGMCPIIYNVVEELKTSLGFRISGE